MMYRVRHTPQAHREVAAIAKALAPYPEMGRRIFEELDRKLAGLKDNPFGCPAYPANPKYRQMHIEGHSIFYTVDEGNHEVIVCHVYYAKRDMARLLRK